MLHCQMRATARPDGNDAPLPSMPRQCVRPPPRKIPPGWSYFFQSELRPEPTTPRSIFPAIPSQPLSSLNLARMEHFEFIGKNIAHCMQRLHCLVRFALINLAHGKTYMNQHPVAWCNAFWTHQRNAHVTFHAGYNDFRDGILVIYNL